MRNHYYQRVVNSLNSIRVFKYLFTIILLCFVQNFGFAQVASYTQATIAGTYTPITGTTWQSGTTLGTNAVSGAIALPWSFNYNGKVYSSIYISNNGFIAFTDVATLAPAAANITPISQTSASGTLTNGYDGAIAGLGCDLVHSTVAGAAPSIIYGASGSDFVVQYTDVARTAQGALERLSFQIRLTQTTNVINIVYGGTISSTSTATTSYPQVGLRGASYWDWRNLTAVAGATAFTAPTSQASVGTAVSTSTIALKSGSLPSVGTTYKFTPPTFLATPAYAAVPTSTNFDTWINGMSTGDLPGANWRTWPSYGDRSFRIHSVTSGAGNAWTTATSGALTIAAPSTGSCARFHTYNACSGSSGYMDYYLNFSAAGSKVLTFDAINTSGTDNIKVFLSTDGGATFGAALTTLTGTPAAWTTQTVQLGSSTSATCVLRFQATGDYGTTDIGIDNVSISVVSCVQPSALVTSAITSSSAAISWTAASPAPASGYEFYYSTSATAPTAGTTPSGTTGAGVTTANLTGLTANTTYYFWVRSNCGGGNGTSAWAGSSSFYTGYCQPVGLTSSTTYYLSNVVTTGGVTNISNATVAGAGGYTNYTATLGCSNYIGAPTTITLNQSSSTGYFYCWIDWNNDLDFADANETIFATTAYTASNTGTINIPAGTPNGNYRMRVANSFSGAITSCGPDAWGEYEDYIFSVVTAPSCLAPTALISSAITSTSATISWTAPSPAPASGYDYYYSTSATAPTAGTTPSGTTAAGVTTANLTGLTANTTYYFWVRGNCGTGTSAWAGSSSFYTGYCQPTGSTTYYLSNASTTGGLTNFANATGASAGGYGNYSSTISCSQIAGSTITINLTETGGTSYFYGWIDWNNDLDFADAGEAIFATTSYAATYSGVYTVPVTATPGSYRMRFANSDLGTISGPCGPWTYGEFEDYTFIVATPPSCYPPTALTTNSTTTTGTTISWTAPATAPGSGYNYYVSTSNTAPTGATTPTGSTAAGVTSATITGLTANTTYYFWVQSNCGAGDLSVWAGSSSFYTGYCVPTGLTTSTTYYVSNVVTSGGLTNISNATTAAAGGYINYASTISCSNYPSTPTSITVTASSGTNYFYCWIDWNNDLDFADANETVFATTTYTASNTGTINIPAGTPAGTYRMRVANSWSGAITACGTATYGEYEDYAFVVTPLPLCSGTPSPGVTVASQTAFCSGTGSVNLSMSTTILSSGISYQWQSSTDGVSYSDVSGATSATYTTPTLSSTTYYQCVVTCSAGGSATSTPVLALNPCFQVDLFAFKKAAGNCKFVNTAVPFTVKVN